MVEQIKETLKTDCCSIYLADHIKQHFLLVASDGLAESSLGQTTIGFTEGLVGLVGQREEPLNIANAQNHPQFIHAPEVASKNVLILTKSASTSLVGSIKPSIPMVLMALST